MSLIPERRIKKLELTPLVVTSDITLDRKLHSGRVILISNPAGLTITLPKSVGLGDVYRFRLVNPITSNSLVIKVGSSSDQITGEIDNRTDTSANMAGYYTISGATDTITLNGSTQGGVQRGERLRLEDLEVGFFYVDGQVRSTGTNASPFSSTV